MVRNAVVRVQDNLAVRATRQVKALGRDVVEPVALAAKGDVFVGMMIEGGSFVSELVDDGEFDLG